MRAGLIVMLVLAPSLWSAPALACRVASNQTALLHETLPPLEPGMVAAEVEILDGRERRELFDPIDARIVRMIEGDFKGGTLRMTFTVVSSCDSFPQLGERGIAVGVVVGETDEVLSISPMRALSDRQREQQAAAKASAAH
jgi:hypothetical protein